MGATLSISRSIATLESPSSPRLFRGRCGCCTPLLQQPAAHLCTIAYKGCASPLTLKPTFPGGHCLTTVTWSPPSLIGAAVHVSFSFIEYGAAPAAILRGVLALGGDAYPSVNVPDRPPPRRRRALLALMSARRPRYKPARASGISGPFGRGR